MGSAVVKFSAILMFVGMCFADLVTEACLGCICQAASGCKQSLECEYNACGLFRITEPYWIDAGKPTVDEAPVNSSNAFNNCAFDPYCAARTVQGYMRIFENDCNGDGQINCYDYVAIHKMGPYACMGDMHSDYVSVFYQCLASVAAQQNEYRQG